MRDAYPCAELPEKGAIRLRKAADFSDNPVEPTRDGHKERASAADLVELTGWDEA